MRSNPMSDPYAELRALSHARVGLIWAQAQAGIPLEGEDANLARALQEHPEYHDVWEQAATNPTEEEVVRDGVNPFLHIAIHTVVENQIAARDPPQVAETLETLMQAGYDRHDATHAIASALAEEIYEIMRYERPFSARKYLRALRKLVRPARRHPAKRRQRRS
jgi:hypothetical protein